MKTLSKFQQFRADLDNPRSACVICGELTQNQMTDRETGATVKCHTRCGDNIPLVIVRGGKSFNVMEIVLQRNVRNTMTPYNYGIGVSDPSVLGGCYQDPLCTRNLRGRESQHEYYKLVPAPPVAS
jgi:hypothetical protein